MKKLFFIPCILGASLLASCSSESELAQGGDSDVLTASQWSHQIANSNVEINLGSGVKGTRASIQNDDDNLFELNGIGLFCLATAKNNVNPNEANISYAEGSTGFKYSVWLNNEEVNAKKDAESNVTNLKWADEGKKYYPTGNWHKYAFYGYYPKQEAGNITYTENQISVSYTNLDGTKDIIYGKAKNDADYAYSAYWFRQEAHANDVPTVAFNHKLVLLDFAIKPGSDKDAAKTMGVTKVEVVKVPTTGSLIIADKETPAYEGVMVFDWENSLQDIALKAAEDAELETEFTEYSVDNTKKALWVTDDEKTIGEGVLVPVPDYDTNNSYRYQIKVTMMDKDGNIFEPEYPMDLVTTDNLEAGHKYKVTMTINGPKEITLNATLTKWVEDNTNIGGITL